MSVESQVINPEGRRCIDCEMMKLKQFNSHTEIWTGYCFILHRIVNGNDRHLAREPTLFKWE